MKSNSGVFEARLAGFNYWTHMKSKGKKEFGDLTDSDAIHWDWMYCISQFKKKA